MDDDKDKARAEDEPDKDAAEGDDMPEGLEPNGVCGTCGMGNTDNAKFCNQCGASMAAPPLESEDEPPPSSKKPGAKAFAAPKKVSAESSVAAILGASSESVPALKTAAIELRHIRDTAAAVFSTADSAEIVGNLLTLPERLAAGDKAIRDHAKATADSEKKERWELARRLNALNLAGRPRSSIFVDKVNSEGKRTAVGLQPEYAKKDLGEFRGIVSSLERSAPKARRNPFEASREDAEQRALASAQRSAGGPSMSGDITAADLAWAKQQPAFARLADKRPVAEHDKIARQIVSTARAMGGVQ